MKIKILNLKLIFVVLGSYGFFNWLSDKSYVKLAFRIFMKRKLNLKNPTTYNEKLQWLKLYDHNPNYTDLVDKYTVRKYISEKIGEKYLIPIIGVWDKFEDIDFSIFPDRFVLKCTHDSGGVVICKDKNKLDIEAVRKKINKCLKRNYFISNREWPYKNIKPRIIAEEYMVEESETQLKDYKFFCFNGKVKILFVASDRGMDTRFDFYTPDFNHLPFMQHYMNSNKIINKPLGLNEMISLAEKLSSGMTHVRVDFYDIKGKVYFGEMTFFHFSGIEKFEPEKWDYVLGKWLELPK